MKFCTFLFAALLAVGSFHAAEARDPRLTKRKVQPASKYRSRKNKTPKQKKYKAPKTGRVKYRRK